MRRDWHQQRALNSCADQDLSQTRSEIVPERSPTTVLRREDVLTSGRLLPVVPASEGLIEGGRLTAALRAKGLVWDHSG